MPVREQPRARPERRRARALPWPPAERAALVAALLDWYRRNRRALPWRTRRSAYRTLVSEVMLQQTQVATVVPYYRRFLRRFPTLASLARAPRAELLRVWAGLGYYTRARNLQAAAQTVLARHRGRIPRTAEALRELPGIGPYTAAAVAAIGFGQPVFALDGNAARVLARLSATRGPLDRRAAQDRLRALGQALVPADAAGDFVQAVMELGSLVCTPRQPRCADCPVRASCRACARGLTSAIPPPRVRPRARPLLALAVIATRGDRVLLQERPQRGLLAGTWAPPLLPAPGRTAQRRACADGFLAELGLCWADGPPRNAWVRHVFSHLDVRADVAAGAVRGVLRAERSLRARGAPLGCDGRLVFVRPAEVALSSFARKLLRAAAVL